MRSVDELLHVLAERAARALILQLPHSSEFVVLLSLALVVLLCRYVSAEVEGEEPFFPLPVLVAPCMKYDDSRGLVCLELVQQVPLPYLAVAAAAAAAAEAYTRITGLSAAA